MASCSYKDLINELVETSHDYIREAYQQINYYNASVYKDEIVRNLNRKVDALRTLATFINHEIVLEPIRDFDSFKPVGGNSVNIVEHSLTARISKLLVQMDNSLKEYAELLSENHTYLRDQKIDQSLRRQRRKLLSICRRGTRSWALLQSI